LRTLRSCGVAVVRRPPVASGVARFTSWLGLGSGGHKRRRAARGELRVRHSRGGTL